DPPSAVFTGEVPRVTDVGAEPNDVVRVGAEIAGEVEAPQLRLFFQLLQQRVLSALLEERRDQVLALCRRGPAVDVDANRLVGAGGGVAHVQRITQDGHLVCPEGCIRLRGGKHTQRDRHQARNDRRQRSCPHTDLPENSADCARIVPRAIRRVADRFVAGACGTLACPPCFVVVATGVRVRGGYREDLAIRSVCAALTRWPSISEYTYVIRNEAGPANRTCAVDSSATGTTTPAMDSYERTISTFLTQNDGFFASRPCRRTKFPSFGCRNTVPDTSARSCRFGDSRIFARPSSSTPLGWNA